LVAKEEAIGRIAETGVLVGAGYAVGKQGREAGGHALAGVVVDGAPGEEAGRGVGGGAGGDRSQRARVGDGAGGIGQGVEEAGIDVVGKRFLKLGRHLGHPQLAKGGAVVVLERDLGRILAIVDQRHVLNIRLFSHLS